MLNEQPLIFLEDKRKRQMDKKIMERLEYLENETDIIEPFIAMPDLSDDGLILSGIHLKTRDMIYPFSAGTDLGCGYRVFHIPQKKELFNLDKDKLTKLGGELTSNSVSKHLNKWLYSLYKSKNYGELNSFFKMNNIHTPLIPSFNKETPHLLREESFENAWGTIAIGNHFVEIRGINKIFDNETAQLLGLNEGELVGHIHSGAGKLIEKDFEKYLGLFVKEYKRNNSLLSDDNGYEIVLNKDLPLSQRFLADAIDSINFSAINRSLLLFKLKSWLGYEINDLFDVFHDGFEIENETISSYKGIQPYANVKGLDIAIIPGSLQDVSYLVKRKANVPLINHGTGEGEFGKEPNYFNVLTNLNNPIKRKYYDIESTIKYCLEEGLIEIIAELKPYICIKNERRESFIG